MGWFNHQPEKHWNNFVFLSYDSPDCRDTSTTLEADVETPFGRNISMQKTARLVDPSTGSSQEVAGEVSNIYTIIRPHCNPQLDSTD